jgi:hypothetical protein
MLPEEYTNFGGFLGSTKVHRVAELIRPIHGKKTVL